MGSRVLSHIGLHVRVHDKSIENMRKATLSCTVTIDAGEEAVTHKVSIPILQNTKPLVAGEELLLHEDPQSATTAAPPQTLPPAKKRKAGSNKMGSPMKQQKKTETAIRQF